MYDQIRGLAEQYIFGELREHHSPKGLQLQGKCPFHGEGQEKTPSFYWNMDTGLFFCHSCKTRGSFADFLTLVGIDKAEAREILSSANYTSAFKILQSPFQRVRGHNPLTSNPVLPENVLGLFDRTSVRMLEAGFTEEIMRRYDIGYDLFNQRITFPIRDVFGRLIGISGRADGDGFPRYKIYDEEDWIHVYPGYKLEKANTLWNVHNLWAQYVSCYDATQPEPVTIMVEGFKAALYLLQLGYDNVIALMGSYMSQVQRFILSNIGGIVLIFLDYDNAGRTGGSKILSELRSGSSVTPLLVTYPQGTPDKTQPDDLDPAQIDRMITEVLLR